MGLLSFQAICDLSLPDYMSNIINVGIQQGGVENTAPDVMRKSEFDRIKIFMDDTDTKEVLSNYKLLDKNTLSSNDYKKYVKDYPILKTTPLYKLNTNDKKIISKLNDILAKPILIVYNIEQKKFAGFDNMQNLPPNVDIFMVLAQMPKEQFNVLIKQIDDKFKNLPNSMINQAAVSYVVAIVFLIIIKINE
jgi:ATP-binding cassette subfamily B protein